MQIQTWSVVVRSIIQIVCLNITIVHPNANDVFNGADKNLNKHHDEI